MANCCITFLFYSYAAASIIYLMIGAFAASGNAAILTEHYKFDENNKITEEERKGVKSRTLAQYFFASAVTVIITVLLYIFFHSLSLFRRSFTIYGIAKSHLNRYIPFISF